MHPVVVHQNMPLIGSSPSGTQNKVMELPRSIAREVLELQMCLASQMNNYATSAEVREGNHLGFLNGL